MVKQFLYIIRTKFLIVHIQELNFHWTRIEQCIVCAVMHVSVIPSHLGYGSRGAGGAPTKRYFDL
jgi:hypothetical protein